MLDIKLLDCTLRDGGFFNDWRFGQKNIVGIFEGLASAGVDIIEIGFLDERRPFDPDRSIMPDTDSARKLYGKLQRKGALVVGMIDYGTCRLTSICPRAASTLDGIRVIFKKHLMEGALRFCAELKALGYLVFVQPVSITEYSDRDIKTLASLVNTISPYAVSVVDTYGLLHDEELLRYFKLLDQALAPRIALGYHAHNNLQLAYANCITVIKGTNASKSQRTLLLDGSLCGMGKSAGNAPLELLALYLNRYMGAHYHVSTILGLIDRHISSFYTSAPWGYNIHYFLAAAQGCHPNYVAYLRSKGLFGDTIYTLLGKLEKSKRLSFDKAHIEALYQNEEKERAHESLPL